MKNHCFNVAVVRPFLGALVIFLVSSLSALSWAGNNGGAAFGIWPDTGQSRCYVNNGEVVCPEEGEPFFGQDAQFLTNERSYTKLGEGGVELPDSATPEDGWIMTRDNVTGLVWEIKTSDSSLHNWEAHYTWCDTDPATNGGYNGTCSFDTDTEDFINALNETGFGGYSDWRLPTVKELSSLVNSNAGQPPAIDTAFFPNTLAFFYWTATSHHASPYSAHAVSFKDGSVSIYAKRSFYGVRAVRGGHPAPANHLVDNNDGTVTDTVTGLMWQKCNIGQEWNAATGQCEGNALEYAWQYALLKCDELELAGYDDWRLPDRNELQSLMDYDCSSPLIDRSIFPDTERDFYWSSTTFAQNFNNASRVDFGGGGILNRYFKHYGSYVRAVRGGRATYLDSWLMGHVRSFATDAPVAGAVVVASSGRSTESLDDGSFRLGLGGNGTYDITVTRDGFQTTTVEDVQVADRGETEKDFYLAVPGTFEIVSALLPYASIGKPYSSRVMISGGIYPYEFSVVSGSMPAGFTLDSATGVISGTSNEHGIYTFTVGVTDSGSEYREREFTIGVTEPLVIHNPSSLPQATLGERYFVEIDVTGGTPPYSYSITEGTLPEGLELDDVTGHLQGNASEDGSFTFTVRVTDASPKSTEKRFSIQSVKPLTITTERLYYGIVGREFIQILMDAGGSGYPRWSVYAGSLPRGISLNASAGQLRGIPAEAGSATVVFQAEDQVGRKAYRDYNFLVVPPLEFSTSRMPTGHVGYEYSERVPVTGGVGPYTFSCTGELPDGLSFEPESGTISGIPTTAGGSTLEIQVSDSTWPSRQRVSRSVDIGVNSSSATIITPSILPSGRLGVPLSPITLEAAGGAAPYVWEIVIGNLPSGVLLHRETGEISGTPVDSGSYNFTVKLTEADGNTEYKNFSLHISSALEIVTDAVPDGGVGRYYNFVIEAVGGMPSYEWSLTGGSLPAGLSLSAETGTVHGVPAETGSYPFTVQVKDSSSTQGVAEKRFVIRVNSHLFIDTASVPDGIKASPYDANISASLGTPPYTFTLVDGTLPPGLALTSDARSATISGIPLQTGDYGFAMEVSDSSSPPATVRKAFSIGIFDEMAFATSSLEDPERGRPYDGVIHISGGEPPYRFKVVSGMLTPGLSLNSATGVVSGITWLNAGKSFNFTVEVTDSSPARRTIRKTYRMVVVCSASYTISGTITRYGQPLEGVAVNLDGEATGQAMTEADGSYIFTGLSNGDYRISPLLSGHSFDPPAREVGVSGSDVSGLDFEAVKMGDADQDGDVDGLDLVTLSDLLVQGGYAPVLDFNEDGVVDASDAEIFASRFGQ